MARASKLSAAKASPYFVETMAARLVHELPDDENWSYEIKFDGYRGLGSKNGDQIRLMSRNDKSLGDDFPVIVDALRNLKADSALVDGEVVALDEKGHPSFQLLQNRRSSHRTVVYYVFDLLYFNGEDWRHRPLSERRAKLEEIVTPTQNLKLSANFNGPAGVVRDAIGKLGLEGVIAKRKDSTYRAGDSSGAWVKLKLNAEQEFVIGGYERGTPLESLIVGYYEGAKLVSVGKVRNGLNPLLRRTLAKGLAPLAIAECPFSNLPNSKASRWGDGITAEDMKRIQWVKPVVVAQIAFTEWTRGGKLRHPAFKGLRSDVSAKDVKRETPA